MEIARADIRYRDGRPSQLWARSVMDKPAPV